MNTTCVVGLSLAHCLRQKCAFKIGLNRDTFWLPLDNLWLQPLAVGKRYDLTVNIGLSSFYCLDHSTRVRRVVGWNLTWNLHFFWVLCGWFSPTWFSNLKIIWFILFYLFNRINGIYELLKEQSALLKSLDPARKRKEQDVFPFGV